MIAVLLTLFAIPFAMQGSSALGDGLDAVMAGGALTKGQVNSVASTPVVVPTNHIDQAGDTAGQSFTGALVR